MRNIFPSLLFIVFGFAVFFNVLNSPFYMDDIVHITRNPDIHNLGSIPSFYIKSNPFKGDGESIMSIIYRPVFFTFFTVLFVVGRELPLPLHLFQVSIYSLNSVLVFLFFKKFFQRKLAFLLALIFLVHPANEEVAQYISITQDALFFFFGMMAICLVSTKYVAKLRTMIACTILLLLSLLSKETGVLFLIIVLIYVFLFRKSDFWKYALSAGFAGMIYAILRFIASKTPSTVSIKSYHFSSFSDQIVIVPKVVFYYIEQIVTPTLFLPDFSYLESTEIKSAIIPFFISALVVAILVIVGSWIRRYFKSSFKEYLFFLIWFIIGIGLHSQIIPLDVIIASRWIYFPIVGVIGMVGVVVTILGPYLSRYKFLFLILYFLYIITFALATVKLNLIRENPKSYEVQSSNN